MPKEAYLEVIHISVSFDPTGLRKIFDLPVANQRREQMESDTGLSEKRK